MLHRRGKARRVFACAIACASAAVLALLSLPHTVQAATKDEQPVQVGLIDSNDRGARAPAYVDPGPNAPINVDADQMQHDRSTGVVTAIGDVLIEYGPYTLIADTVVYDPRQNLMTAIGNVVFREPNGNIARSERMVLSDDFKEGFIEYLRVTLTNRAWIIAQTSERHGNVNIFYNVTYSRCNECITDNGTPLWQLRSRQVTHDMDERRLYYEDSTLEFLGVPIFGLPWMSQPDPSVNKASGFLLPRIITSDELGVGVEIPYFWNLAPHYDVTFRPTVTTRQGLLLQTDWRHRLANGQYDITIAGIYQLDPGVTPPGDRRFRGSVSSAGSFSLNEHWDWGWDGTATTDDTFLRSYKINRRTDLISQLYLIGLNDRNYFDGRAYSFQGLLAADDNDTIPYALPAIHHYYYFDQAVFGGELGLDTHIYNLQRDIGADSARLTSELHWQNRIVNDYGQVITPFAGVRGDVYIVDNVPDPTVLGGFRGQETVARVFPTAGVDVRWPFSRATENTTQIFEPVGQIITSTNETNTDQLPNEDSIQFEFDASNIFLQNKFNGIDRVEGGTRANIGANYTVLFNDGSFIRATAGETFHIAGDNSFGAGTGLDTTRSDFIAGIAFQPIQNVRVSSMMRFDEDTFDIERHDLSAHGVFGPVTISAHYSDLARAAAFGRPFATEQINVGGTLSLSDYWQIFGGFRYDIRLDKQISNVVGLRFLCECFKAELVYSENFTSDREVDPDTSIMLNVIFKTLGGGSIRSEID